MNNSLAACLALLVSCLCTLPAHARVTRIVVEHKQSPAFEGKAFGNVGQYANLSGKAYGEIDPKDPHNTIITDIRFAPRNARGLVEYVATFTLVKPLDVSKANGVLLYAVPNRGNRISVPAFGVAGESGDEFFLKRGYVILHSGCTLLDYDYGVEFNYADLSGVMTVVPPIIKRPLPTFVPKVNADGNETSGITSPLHQAPLGTYLGWNVTRTGFYKGRGCGFAGGFIPFAKTKAERLAKGDPRLSLEERDKDHAGYVAAVRQAAERLVQQGFLLAEDAARLLAQANESNVLR